MTYNYLIKSPRHLVQYLACNLMPRGYCYYSTAFIPEGCDPILVDAKLTLAYNCHLTKVQQFRKRKAGFASVKYLRCGQIAFLLATDGRSSFFEREAWRDARLQPIHIAGYSLRVDKDTGKVSVRIHRDAQKYIRKEFLLKVNWSVGWWERHIRAFPFLSFAGVRDNLFHELRELNYARKLLRLPPIDWRRCVKKKFKVEPVYEPTAVELLELLAYETKRGKRQASNLVTSPSPIAVSTRPTAKET